MPTPRELLDLEIARTRAEVGLRSRYDARDNHVQRERSALTEAFGRTVCHPGKGTSLPGLGYPAAVTLPEVT